MWTARGRTIRVETLHGSPRPVQLDGEVCGTTPFEAQVIPASLSVLVDPATLPDAQGKANG